LPNAGRDLQVNKFASAGFSLVEMAMVLVMIGIIALIAVPGVQTMSQGMQLDGAANGIAGELRLARSKAMATGADQMMHFSPDSLGSDYHTHNGAGIGASWKLPNGIKFTDGSFHSITMLSSGRASTSAFIAIQDRRGDVDTVSVEASGLICVY
jgi:prepilin-type N-terminal cleavage/methylation domain-containing protein